MPHDFLFGLIRVPMWDYYWGLTKAQVEILTIDQPILVYEKDKNKPKPGEKGFKRTAAQAQKAYEQWKKRQEEEKKKGIKIDLNTFLSTGEKKEVQ